MMSTRKSLLSRPLDLAYFIYFVIHIPATLFIDTQALIPRHLVPVPMQSCINWYLHTSADPIIAGAFGLNGDPRKWAWIKSFLVLELTFLLPTFIIGARALLKDSKKYYPLFLIYAATASVTTLPCLATVLSTPIASTARSTALLSPYEPASALELAELFTITQEQRFLLLLSYIPFLLVPLFMCLDMAIRVSKGQLQAQEADKKNL